MKTETFNVKTKCDSFKRSFTQYVPHTSEELDDGECFGFFENHFFWLYEKKAPRSLGRLTGNFLCGKIAEDGTINFAIKRTLESIILTIIFPVLLLLGGAFLSLILWDIGPFLIAFCPALVFATFNFIHPQKHRQNLLDTLTRIVEISL